MATIWTTSRHAHFLPSIKGGECGAIFNELGACCQTGELMPSPEQRAPDQHGNSCARQDPKRVNNRRHIPLPRHFILHLIRTNHRLSRTRPSLLIFRNRERNNIINLRSPLPITESRDVNKNLIAAERRRQEAVPLVVVPANKLSFDPLQRRRKPSSAALPSAVSSHRNAAPLISTVAHNAA